MRPSRRRKQSYGEFVLEPEVLADCLEFALVFILGFLPLGVIHWADSSLRLNPRDLARRLPRPRLVKGGVLSLISQWIVDRLS